MKGTQNIAGSRVRIIRAKQKISQEALAAKCGVLGWDISRGTLAKIEAQVRCLTDKEILILAKALKIGFRDLLGEEPYRCKTHKS